jgi:HK97 family phage portal protein
MDEVNSIMADKAEMKLGSSLPSKHRSYEVKSMESFERSFDEDSGSSATWETEAKAILEGYTLRALFTDGGWVYTLVDHYARFMSMAYPKMKQRIVEEDEERYEPLDGHPIGQLLKAPNPYMRWSSFSYSLYVDYLLMGNVLIWKDEKGQLWRLPPEKLTMLFDEKNGYTPIGYVATDDTLEDYGINRNKFTTKEVLHIRRPNPNTIWWGLSPFIPGRRSVLFDRYSKDYLLKFYNRGAAPDAVLETEDELTPAQQAQLVRTFEQKYTGRQNQRRTILLPQGVKFNPITVDMVSQRFIELVESNRDEIINITHTPKHALSLQEAGSLGSEEHRLALEYYFNTTLLPDIECFATELGHFLIPEDEKETTELWFETTHLESLFENMTRKVELIEKMRSVATVNEVRTKILEWEELPEGGDVLISLNQPAQPAFGSFNLSLPDGQQAKQEDKATTTNTPVRYENIDFTPPQDVANNAERGLAMRREFRRGGTEVGIKRATQLARREVISSDTARRMYRFFIRHEANRDSTLPNGDPGNGKIAWLLWGGDPGFRWAKKLWEQMERADEAKGNHVDRASFLAAQEDDSALFMRFDRNQKNLHKMQTKFADRIEKMQKALDEAEENKIEEYQKSVRSTLLQMLSLSMPIIERTVKEKTKDTEADLKRLERNLSSAYNRLGRGYRENFEEQNKESVELGYNSNMELIFNEPAREAIEALKARDAQGRLALLSERGIESFRNISETTTKQIVGRVRKGLEQNKTVNQIAKDIRDSYPEIVLNRSKTIARTETLTAFSIGQQAQLENTMEVVPEAKKVWISARDERVRGNPNGLYPDSKADHWELSGEIKDIDKEFSNGLMLPRDTSEGPAEVINCRCSSAPLLPEDIEEFEDELTNE